MVYSAAEAIVVHELRSSVTERWRTTRRKLERRALGMWEGAMHFLKLGGGDSAKSPGGAGAALASGALAGHGAEAAVVSPLFTLWLTLFVMMMALAYFLAFFV